jgi:hypothetical protein
MDVSERKSNGFLMGLDRESYVALDELCNKEGMLDVTENSIESNDTTFLLSFQDFPHILFMIFELFINDFI